MVGFMGSGVFKLLHAKNIVLYYLLFMIYFILPVAMLFQGKNTVQVTNYTLHTSTA